MGTCPQFRPADLIRRMAGGGEDHSGLIRPGYVSLGRTYGNMRQLVVFQIRLRPVAVAPRCCGGAPAHAEKRVALVIGNNDYKNVPKLQKAVNDARTMGDTLKQLGFTVMVAENQTPAGLQREPAGVRQGARSPAIPRSSSSPAMVLKSPARISCCRPTCRRRAKARKNWCATPRCSPIASSSGCRTRMCAPRSWCSTPAATIRSSAPAPARWPAAAGWRR